MLRTKTITQNVTGSILGQRKPPGMELSLRPVAEDLGDFSELVHKASWLSQSGVEFSITCSQNNPDTDKSLQLAGWWEKPIVGAKSSTRPGNDLGCFFHLRPSASPICQREVPQFCRRNDILVPLHFIRKGLAQCIAKSTLVTGSDKEPGSPRSLPSTRSVWTPTRSVPALDLTGSASLSAQLSSAAPPCALTTVGLKQGLVPPRQD
uniref:Uncharacterized protein n=1 Tax=Myotis myotis TaxID=51298 RepID=A0A7J7Z5W0_MYOMY|nr:hypothetical protein mMyoMyo1_010753 [Myotis myotis]